LAEKLERLLADAALRQELGARAAARAREHYNWEYITAEYEQLFARLLHR
jgi:glycosyltransferase involved in cell wall biosynthesis